MARNIRSTKRTGRLTDVVNAPGEGRIVAAGNGKPHTSSFITDQRVAWSMLNRYSPIRGLTPEVLAAQLDNWHIGYLRQCALTFDAIAHRDFVCSTVIPKRLAAATRHPWQIVIPKEYGDDPMAQRHKETLEYFYEHLECTDALEPDIRGGVRLMLKQMLWAQGMRWAVHEIVWRPSPDGLTATVINVPIWFFERRTGKLRFLKNDWDIEGEPLDEGAWMITAGQGLMEPSAVCYLYKTLALKDWLIYIEKHSLPAVFGRTAAAIGSAQWEALEQAVQQVLSGAAGVINSSDEITKLTFAAEGQIPHPGLIELMNRAISMLWRGADLSTLSAGSGMGQGASIQAEESEFLEADDLVLLSETCQQYLDRYVIKYTFGEDAEPMAYFHVGRPRQIDASTELAIDRFLLEAGAPLSVTDVLERYNRPVPDEDEEVLTKPQPASAGGLEALPVLAQEKRDNDEPERALIDLAEALKDDLRPLADRIRELLEIEDEAELRQALEELRQELPRYLAKHPKMADAIEERLKLAFASTWNAIESGRDKHAANAFYGHVGRPGLRGGSLPADEGGASASEIRSMRARTTYKPADKRKQDIASESEHHIASVIKGKVTDGNEPFDVVSGKLAIEVKTIIDGKNPKITMHPESLRRKVRYARRNGVEPFTVAVDMRSGKREFYVKRGVGSFRLSSMVKVGPKETVKDVITRLNKTKSKK